jgi:hypothetical protein
MSDRDRSGFFKAVTTVFIVVLIAIALKATWDLSASHTAYSQTADQKAQDYAESAQDRISRTCVELSPAESAECIREIIETTKEAQTAQHDLAAQRSMALWAAAMFWATVSTVVVAAIGIYYVRNTLMETRRIGQAQVRAYLADDGFNVGWAKADDGRPIVDNIEAIWKNTGLSPALSCRINLILTGLLPEEAEKPIQGNANAPESQKLGTISIAAGARALCGGTSLSADQTADWLEGRNILVVHSFAVYKDVFGNTWRTETCHQMVHVERPEGNKIRYKIYPHHNSAT